MQTNSSRKEILQRIATASQRRSACLRAIEPKEIYHSIAPDAVVCFKNELEAINGKCVLCENEILLYSQIKNFCSEYGVKKMFCRDSYLAGQLDKNQIAYTQNEAEFESIDAGITGCEFLVARTGSVIVSSASPSGRQMHAFPPVHIVVAHVSQLVDYLSDAYALIQEKYGEYLPSAITTITGPSRTADIEKTLVLGAHGPKELVVFLCLE